MKNMYRILAVNPGSTSTKVGCYENDKELFSINIEHEAEELKKFPDVQDQLGYRKKKIETVLAAENFDVSTFDVYVGRGGGLNPLLGGVYYVDDTVLNDARKGMAGQHPAQLGCQIVDLFARENNAEAYIVNPPDTDEYEAISRITGLAGVYRQSHLHALNQKEIAHRYAEQVGKKYEECNLIICHIGGGISITAHKTGRMIDGNDIIKGEGPMTPNRTGALCTVDLLKMCFSGDYTQKELYKNISKNGGLVSHLGTSDARKVEKMIADGDEYAKLVYDAMIYQIAKYIGSCSCSLKGKVDAIILTGGMANSKYLTDMLKEYVEWIGNIVIMAGEFEMQGLVSGVLRVKNGIEQPKRYTGEPVWKGAEEYKRLS